MNHANRDTARFHDFPRIFPNPKKTGAQVAERGTMLKKLESEEEIGGVVDTGFVFPRRRNQTKINEAIEHWRASQTRSEVGMTKRLAFSLKVHGYDEHEIEYPEDASRICVRARTHKMVGLSSRS